MACCAVPRCLKNQKNNTDIGFYSLPADPKRASLWIQRIRREDKLPIKVVVCETHFSVDAFDESVEFRRSHQPKGIILLKYILRSFRLSKQKNRSMHFMR